MLKRITLRISILFIGLSFVLGPLGAQVSQEAALREHVRVLTADSLAGRGAGTAGEKSAAAYISRCFKAYGLEFIYPDGMQDFSVVDARGDTLSSQNVVGIVPGSDPDLREEYIVIGAHYDHLGIQKITVNGKDSLVVYPGADDNASGTALLLELAKTAAAQPWFFKRSLVFVAFGAEEIGLVGSWYFVNRAFSPIAQVVLMLNLDMLGRSGAKNPFCAYTVTPDAALADLLWSADALPGMQPKVLDTDCFPSDHRHFYANRIPTVLFTSGLHSDYHAYRDKPHLLDYVEMERRTAYLYAFLWQAARVETLPSLPAASEGQDEKVRVYALADLDRWPKFQHGDEAQFLKLWVNKYLTYPDAAVSRGVQGRVLVQFIIEADGSVTQAEVIKSVDPLLDGEALRVVSASPKWKPGVKNGRAVRARYVVPVYFVLKQR